MGGSSHHIRNTQHFIEEAKSIQLQQGEIISSYDIKALFSLVPVDPALNIIHNKLPQDATLQSRTSLSIPNIMSLLRFCLKGTFFIFQGKYYEQVKDLVQVCQWYICHPQGRTCTTVPYSPKLLGPQHTSHH